MSESFIISLFSVLLVGKVVFVVHFIYKRRARAAEARATAAAAAAAAALNAAGPEVLVEDPMTQRLLLFSGSTTSLDRTQSPPDYTTKDMHLEFANDPPPPSFTDVVAVPATAATATTHTHGAHRASESNSIWNHHHRRSLNLDAGAAGRMSVPMAAYTAPGTVSIQEGSTSEASTGAARTRTRALSCPGSRHQR